MNISLPAELEKEVERAVKKGNYASKSEFIRDLLRIRMGERSNSERITIDEIRKKAVPILKKCGVIKAAVFGSVARGEDTPESDIDMLVQLDPDRKMGLMGFVGLEQELESALRKKVDLGTYNSVNKLLKDRIMKEKISIL